MTYEEYKMAVGDAARTLYEVVRAAALDNLEFDVSIDERMTIDDDVTYACSVGGARILSGFEVPDEKTRLRHYESICDAAGELAAVLSQAAEEHFAFDVEAFWYDSENVAAIVRPRTSYVQM